MQQLLGSFLALRQLLAPAAILIGILVSNRVYALSANVLAYIKLHIFVYNSNNNFIKKLILS